MRSFNDPRKRQERDKSLMPSAPRDDHETESMHGEGDESFDPLATLLSLEKYYEPGEEISCTRLHSLVIGGRQLLRTLQAAHYDLDLEESHRRLIYAIE